MKKEKRQNRFGLMFLISVLIFVILVAAIVLSAFLVNVLIRAGVITDVSEATTDPNDVILFMSVISLILGVGLTVLLGNVFMRPINRLINQMNRLSSGDYRARLFFGKPIGSQPEFAEVVNSFNKLAEELESTELLRSDFINNFSHEFKTPIVSIAGFAKLLRRGNLTREQQREYLQIIEEESLRLSDMATNVMNLTKVENQTILTDVVRYNLSEQIRSCILLLEDKWSRKDLELQPDFGEHTVEANEELLKQVWINLLDNAIKFAPEGHTIRVGITENRDALAVTVTNTGSEIPPEKQKKIWRKFYQAEESHATLGNGIGLAVVKRITELHGGAVSVTSGSDVTSFTVELPKNSN